MKSKRATKILVADDDAPLRLLVTSTLLEQDQDRFDTVEADTGFETVALAEQLSPDLVVLDVNLPGLSGYEVCARLRRSFGDQMAIMFVSGERTESFDRAAAYLIGADDYLVKPFAPAELLERVRSLLRHRRPPRNSRVEGRTLTPRELEVLRLLADGLVQAEIAETLTISPKTVATHIEHVLAKLEVRSRTQAVALAYRDGLLREN